MGSKAHTGDHVKISNSPHTLVLVQGCRALEKLNKLNTEVCTKSLQKYLCLKFSVETAERHHGNSLLLSLESPRPASTGTANCAPLF